MRTILFKLVTGNKNRLSLLLSVFILCVTSAHATLQDSIDTKIELSKTNGYFAYMPRPEWLVIGSDSGEFNTEIHLPRIKAISELTWSQDNRYLTFSAKNRELWLFDLQRKTLSLLEALSTQRSGVKFLPQWSNKNQWLLFVSHKHTQSRPRIYSPEKNHSYALPIAAKEASSIAWANKNNVITVSDFAGKAQRIASFNAFGITIEQAESPNLTALIK